MSAAQQITDYASSLFDVAAFSQLSSGDSLLILGMESTAQRNLDEFGRVGGNFHLYGFEKYIQPKLELILNFIRGMGFSAEPVGRYGYPLKGEINLKQQAIRAGLGRGGKNTIVLNPGYGSRLRFAAIRTNVPLEPTMRSSMTEAENPVCSGCLICIDACPVNALEPYRMPDPSLCLSSSALMPEEEGRLVPCDLCLRLCPVGKEC